MGRPRKQAQGVPPVGGVGVAAGDNPPKSRAHSGALDPWLRGYQAIEQILVKNGFPPTSPWWWTQIVRWRKSGKKRFIARVGRRGGKSTTIMRVLVNEALNGEWTATPGDPAVIPIVSVDKDEAKARLLVIEAILKALGARHEVTGMEIRLLERPCCFRVKTCSIKGVQGFTSIAIYADECAFWENAEDSANPAEQVMAALRPTMATNVATAFEFMVSAPWGTDDYHAKLFDQGETEHQVVAFAQTWVANPTISEDSTHALEPDPVLWARAYGAIPSETVERQWFGNPAELRVDGPVGKKPGVKYWFSIDPAFSHDLFGWAVISSVAGKIGKFGPEDRTTTVEASGSWNVRGQKPSEVLQRLKREVLLPWGADEARLIPVISDQYEQHSLSEIALQHGILLDLRSWTGGEGPETKIGRFRKVRVEALGKRLWVRVGANDGLERQMKRVQMRQMPSGNEKIEIPKAPGESGHADQLLAVVGGASAALMVPAQVPPWLKPPKVEPREDERERTWLMRRAKLERMARQIV